ncbi:peptidoglycan-binding protein LysM [Nonlabens dokdonensis]|uniref:peptidoglycan-binding protein LysM n=2 Tax=Nonlabens dokdonensis TaxID=328515 RepID=UPI0026EE6E8A|nr:peptidoglycan-binding protein LysM [Nonlabens dokdonensis]
MKSQFVSFVAYPALLLMSYSVFNTTSSNTDSSTLDVITDYVTSTETKVKGPIKAPLLEEPSLRDLSLATSGEDSFISFKEALAFKESRGQYWRVNTLGYLGKYQFGATTLAHFGVTDTEAFLNSVNLQERVFLKYLRYNHKSLEPYIEKYEGKTIAGVKVTESGILAAAHLSGPGGVRKFLKSNGNLSSKDAYGSSVRSYMKKFGGYDLSEVL